MRTDRRGIGALGAVAAVALAALATGCGDRGSADKVKGKTLFVQKCGSCHTLARANTKGIQGPNLDYAFGPARRDGIGKSTVAGVVKRQIAYPRRGSIMPADLVSGSAARDVAAYVAFAAGQSGKDTGALANAGAAKTSSKPVVAKGGKLAIDADATGALAFSSTKAQSPAGALEFVMANPSQIQHDIAVKDSSGKILGQGPVVGHNGKSTFTAKLKPGSYEFLCTVPGHEAGGMKGTLTVR